MFTGEIGLEIDELPDKVDEEAREITRYSGRETGKTSAVEEFKRGVEITDWGDDFLR